MTDLDKNEATILDGIELGCFNSRAGLRRDLRPVWDRLVEKGLIEQVSYYVLTADGMSALNELHRAAAHSADKRGEAE